MPKRIRQRAAGLVNRPLHTLGVRLVRDDEVWDRQFAGWIARAKERGVDPNDLGDEEWATDELATALEEWYLPAVGDDAVVVELGPGTGRLTRHLVPRARQVIAVDRSELVTSWLASYLPTVEVHHDAKGRLPLGTASADAFFAHGVFEHLTADETYWFLVDAARVLRPGANAIFNFDNVASPGGLDHLRATSSPGKRSVFHFHHPEAIRCLAIGAGFQRADVHSSKTRTAFASLVR